MMVAQFLSFAPVIVSKSGTGRIPFKTRGDGLEFSTMSEPTLYDLLGGPDGLRALVERFYDHMDSAPEAAHIRSLHPQSLAGSREKLFMFLSGWSGGPALYVERYGHPRLRMRHNPFPIGLRERDEWLWCMNRALDESPFDPETSAYLRERFAEVADAMRNRPN